MENEPISTSTNTDGARRRGRTAGIAALAATVAVIAGVTTSSAQSTSSSTATPAATTTTPSTQSTPSQSTTPAAPSTDDKQPCPEDGHGRGDGDGDGPNGAAPQGDTGTSSGTTSPPATPTTPQV